MNEEFVTPVYLATKDVFQIMLDIQTDKRDLAVEDHLSPSNDANIALGIVGDLKGTILFSFPANMTLKMVKIMCGIEVDEIDSFVSSALGEIANIIGGNAVTKLTACNYNCDIVPPQIYIGEYKSINYENQSVSRVSLQTDIGDLEISIHIEKS